MAMLAASTHEAKRPENDGFKSNLANMLGGEPAKSAVAQQADNSGKQKSKFSRRMRLISKDFNEDKEAGTRASTLKSRANKPEQPEVNAQDIDASGDLDDQAGL